MGEGEEDRQQLQRPHLAGCSTVVAADSIGSTAAGTADMLPVVRVQEAERLAVVGQQSWVEEERRVGWLGVVAAWSGNETDQSMAVCIHQLLGVAVQHCGQELVPSVAGRHNGRVGAGCTGRAGEAASTGSWMQAAAVH
jgi:hypothetical protein